MLVSYEFTGGNINDLSIKYRDAKAGQQPLKPLKPLPAASIVSETNYKSQSIASFFRQPMHLQLWYTPGYSVKRLPRLA